MPSSSHLDLTRGCVCKLRRALYHAIFGRVVFATLLWQARFGKCVWRKDEIHTASHPLFDGDGCAVL